MNGRCPVSIEGAGRTRRVPVCLLAPVLVLGSLAAPAFSRQNPPVPVETLAAEARRAYDAQDFDAALPLLDRLIDALQAPAAKNPASLSALVGAYEMRARARLAPPRLDWDGARADFQALLSRSPRYALLPTTSPRILKLFEDVRRATIGEIALAVVPQDAAVMLDGRPVAWLAAPLAVVAGPHTISARRPGYRPVKETITVQAGESARSVTLTLERASATLSVFTAPAGVRVFVDGVEAGTTPPGPPAPADADWIRAIDQAPETMSGVLVVDPVAPGSHAIELRKDCFATVRKNIDAPERADYRLPPQRLQPATASVRIAAPANARLFVDGQPAGTLPATLEGVCEGRHVFDIRTPSGRFSRQLDVVAGQTVDLGPQVKPAMALVALTGADAAARPARDVFEAVVRAVGDAGAVQLVTPPAEEVGRALLEQNLVPTFLAFDPSRRPASEAAARLATPERLAAAAALARRFDAQGLAAVTVPSREEPGRIWLTLLAAGSRIPDVVEIDLQDEQSRAAAARRLGERFPLSRPSVGIVAIDVADVTGAVVAGVAAGGPAAAAGLAPGDVITRAGGRAVADAAAFAARLREARPGTDLPVTIARPGAETREAALRVGEAPCVVRAADADLPFNTLALDFRARLAEPPEPSREPILRLNLAVALIAVGDWPGAKSELERVTLPDGPGISAGTVAYLRGLCAEQLGDLAEAERLWRLAANAAGAELSEEGPPIQGLAERKLAGLRARAR
jgi:hypothetical protein